MLLDDYLITEGISRKRFAEQIGRSPFLHHGAVQRRLVARARCHAPDRRGDQWSRHSAGFPRSATVRPGRWRRPRTGMRESAVFRCGILLNRRSVTSSSYPWRLRGAGDCHFSPAFPPFNREEAMSEERTCIDCGTALPPKTGKGRPPLRAACKLAFVPGSASSRASATGRIRITVSARRPDR